jgi:hypothetical protein
MIRVNITDEQEVQDLCHIATQICCLRKGSLSYKSRRKELQLPRTVVSNIARIEKCIHYTVIAKVLKRDRCSIYHYESNHQDNYEGWKEYRLLFNRIYNAYNDIKCSKKKFMQAQDIKSYLKSKGVKESLDSKVFISVICEDIKTIIKTDYKNFSDTLELIRLALIDYDYKLDVKI